MYQLWSNMLISEDNLKEILSKFIDVRILVIGDFYLDAYWHIDKTRSSLSLETPWHTNPVVEQHYSPGAAGTVTNNLKALGVGTVYSLGVIGGDGFGTTLLDCLQEKGCLTDYMVIVPDRVTPTYLKPIHRGYENVETEGPRFDIENQQPMSASVENEVIKALEESVSQVDGIIIGDQMAHDNLGVITDRIRERLCELALSYPDKIFLADSRARIGLYTNVIIKPNRFEAQRAIASHSDVSAVDINTAKQCAISLYKHTQESIYITLGEDGILVYNDEQFSHIQGIQIEEKTDPVGAGDSVSAGIVSTLCAVGKENIVEAALIGNLVASVTVTKIGTTGTAAPDEVLQRYRSVYGRN